LKAFVSVEIICVTVFNCLIFSNGFCASPSLVLPNRVAVEVAYGSYPSIILPYTIIDVQLVEARKTTSKKNVDVANAQFEVSSAAVGVHDDCPRHGVSTCDSASPSLTTNRSSMCVFVLTLKFRFRWINFFVFCFLSLKKKMLIAN
jgi:hypothetical protein